MSTASAAIILTFGAYLLLMLAIGYWAYRRTRDSADYFLGGRRLGSWPAALSAGASDMSGWLLLGLPGLALTAGLEALWLAAGLLLGTYLNWRLVARRLRGFSQAAGDALTIPEFFANRFGDPGHLLQVGAALFILVFYLFYTSAGLVAGGKLFENLFDLDIRLATLLGTLFILSYTLFGGFLAVSWTDLVQGLLMAAALLIVPLVALQADGGIGAAFAALGAKHPAHLSPWIDAQGEPLTGVALLSLLAWGLGYFGQPHILARFAGIRDPRAVPLARRIAVGWTALTLTGAILVGLAGVGYVDRHLGGTLADAETIFMVLASALFHPLMTGVLLAAVLAAIMSTADSQLLVASSAFSEDIYKHWLKREPRPGEIMRVGRLSVLLLAALALLLALESERGVLDLVAHAWAGFGAAFGPTLLFALYWPRMNRWGALAGMLAGALTVLAWKQWASATGLYEIVPGVLAATLAIPIASLLTAPPPPEIRDGFARMRQALAEAA